MSYANSLEQATQFKAFSTNLAVSIGNALEEKLSSSSFADNIKNMDSTLAQVNSFMSEELPSVISDAIGEQIKENLVPVFVSLQNAIETLSSSGQSAIADGIKSGASKELTAFADTLQQMNTNLQAVMAQMQETSGSVNSDLTSAINRVVDRLESQGENLQGVGNQVAKDLQDTVAALVNEMGKQQSGMINTSEKINDDLKASISLWWKAFKLALLPWLRRLRSSKVICKIPLTVLQVTWRPKFLRCWLDLKSNLLQLNNKLTTKAILLVKQVRNCLIALQVP